MFMIVLFHMSLHGNFDFSASPFTLNKFYYYLLSLMGIIGDYIFLLIAGYFLIDSSRFKIRRFCSVWFRMFFYSAVIYCIFAAAGRAIFSRSSLFRALTPTLQGTWWFGRIYLEIYIIHPFLNAFLRKLSRRNYRILLAVICIYLCYPSELMPRFNGNSFLEFVSVYIFAAYIRLWADDFGKRKYIFYGCALMLFSAVVISFTSQTPAAIYLSGVDKLLKLGVSLLLFSGFRKLNIRTSRKINIAASATFGVYLIHENNFLSHFLWRTVFPVKTFQDSNIFIPYTITIVLTVYVVCTALELTRSKVFRTLSRGRLL